MKKIGFKMVNNEQKNDLVSYFLKDMKYHGRSERTRRWYGRVLRQFEDFVLSQGEKIDSIQEATSRQCLRWLHMLREEHSTGTIATYASCINRFYTYMISIDIVDRNPMNVVMEEMNESIESDPERRDISIAEMRSFIRNITHPLDRAIITTFLKTGIRVGELVNLDLRDLNINIEYTNFSNQPQCRPQITHESNSIYITKDISYKDTINGEKRLASNKRKRSTIIPVDEELQFELERWLAIRPDSITTAQPLFLNVNDSWGKRLTPSIIRSIIKKHAQRREWYQEGGDATQNVTPHYFRHFFTTHLRNATGERGIVKYLRGDVADDIIDTYTHNWGNNVRETYERSIYRLL